MAKNKAPSITMLIVKPLVMLVIPFILVLSFMPGQNGKTAIELSSILPNSDDLGKIAPSLGIEPLVDDLLDRQPKSRFVESKEAIYKWQDENGQWHFSQSLPPPSVHDKAEQIVVSNRVNTIARPETLPPHESLADRSSNSSSIRSALGLSGSSNSGSGTSSKEKLPELPTEVSLKEIPKLLEHARNVEKVLKHRSEEVGNLYQ